jgi:hypothetical protein
MTVAHMHLVAHYQAGHHIVQSHNHYSIRLCLVSQYICSYTHSM